MAYRHLYRLQTRVRHAYRPKEATIRPTPSHERSIGIRTRLGWSQRRRSHSHCCSPYSCQQHHNSDGTGHHFHRPHDRHFYSVDHRSSCDCTRWYLHLHRQRAPTHTHQGLLHSHHDYLDQDDLPHLDLHNQRYPNCFRLCVQTRGWSLWLASRMVIATRHLA